jgi:predicted nucleotidyltransferase
MRSDLPTVALDVGIPERTLRRAVQRGTVHARRSGPRQIELRTGEEAYLLESWSLVSAIAETLRTERNVRLAVLFGSAARGDAQEGSDVDILVSLAEERPMYIARLTVRLRQALGREVDVLSLRQLREHEPAVLGAVMRDGRPVIDRDGVWPTLIGDRKAVTHAAAIARAKRHIRAARAVAQLTGHEG